MSTDEIIEAARLDYAKATFELVGLGVLGPVGELTEEQRAKSYAAAQRRIMAFAILSALGEPPTEPQEAQQPPPKAEE